jgi:hypothetical protein
MTTKQWLFVTVPMVIIIIGLFVLVFVPNKPALTSVTPQPTPTTATSTDTTQEYGVIDNLISVDVPAKNATVSSPLSISGTARGAWYFEASAPVELRDASGKVIAQGHVDAQGDWMTEDFVPFKATLTFVKQPAGSAGTLVLKNDNPSGDPARQKELDIPVKF